jgi:transcriptional regulator with XRE-family HTH domain
MFSRVVRKPSSVRQVRGRADGRQSLGYPGKETNYLEGNGILGEADYADRMNSKQNNFGALLKTWRKRRHLSQLELVARADISQRHLSFLESGRASPSRSMVLHLAERLGVPLRERNLMLSAAGFSAEYGDQPLDHPTLCQVREMVDRVVRGHEPYPAMAVDRHWTLVTANEAFRVFTEGVDPELLREPANALRVCLHPKGIAQRIVNFPEWRSLLLHQLEREIDVSGDLRLAELLDEFRSYPVTRNAGLPVNSRRAEFAGIAIPLELLVEGEVLSFIGTVTTFGTPANTHLSELTIESFFPADPATAAAMHRMAAHA